jgi:hypothetical protein
MQPSDLNYLENALDSFIETSVHRVAHSGDMCFRYRITTADVKAATGRSRFHDSTIREYRSYFEHHKISAEYDEEFASFNIGVDLNDIILTPTQAKFLSTAMELFRAEHS